MFGHQGVTDPEIIEWCQINGAVWIHADDRARKEHRVILQTSGIRTIWVYRKRGLMTAREQLRILSFVLPKLMEQWKIECGIVIFGWVLQETPYQLLHSGGSPYDMSYS